MVRAQHHRGPDGQGLVQCQRLGPGRPAVTLGHTRLAILDLSDCARQPMSGLDGNAWIVYNGETYNCHALRTELEAAGAGFRSTSDTEVVLRSYEQWGRASVHRLRGMFAFALWDGRQQTLTLVRDRLGIKPVYYYRDSDYLVFASEVCALLASGLVPRRLDAVGVDQYLAYQTVPTPRTLVEGVRLLLPGHQLTIDSRGGMALHAYWDQLRCASAEGAHADVAESRRRVSELLRESAALHLVSDVPMGVFLSGGIDSSAVVSLLRDIGVTPQTFSVSFDEQAYDESPYARAVAAHFGADHVDVRLDRQTLAADLPGIVDGVDHPSGDGINTAVIARAVHKAGLKVALSGLGGDEIFGGYPSFSRLRRWRRWLSLWGRTPEPLRGAAAAVVEGIGRSAAAGKVAAILRTDGSPAQSFPPLRQLFTAPARRRLLEEGVARVAAHARDPYVTLLEEACEGRQDGTGTLVSYAESRTYMHDVLLRDTDQMSMASSLEVRVPLLDHVLVEYVMGLPDSVKFGTGRSKVLLTESLALPLPPQATARPKQGFVLPMDAWMRASLSGFCAHHLGPKGLAGRGIVDAKAVSDLWRGFLAGDGVVTWSRPWALVALNVWIERSGVELGAGTLE